MELFLGFVYGIITIASAVLNCRATCHCCDGSPSNPDSVGAAPVAYAAGGQVPAAATVVNVPAGATVIQQPVPTQQTQDLPPKYDSAMAEEKEDGKYQRLN